MAVMRAGSPSAAGSHLARPVPASSRTGSPNTSSVMPGWIGVASGSSAIRSAIQPARSRAKAAASGSRRGEGAVATISRRVRSSRSDTRRARRLTFRVTAVAGHLQPVAVGQGLPRRGTRPKETHRPRREDLGGLGAPWGAALAGVARRAPVSASQITAAHPRIDLVAEPRAVEDAVVADVRLDVVLLERRRQARAERRAPPGSGRCRRCRRSRPRR